MMSKFVEALGDMVIGFIFLVASIVFIGKSALPYHNPFDVIVPVVQEYSQLTYQEVVDTVGQGGCYTYMADYTRSEVSFSCTVRHDNGVEYRIGGVNEQVGLVSVVLPPTMKVAIGDYTPYGRVQRDSVTCRGKCRYFRTEQGSVVLVTRKLQDRFTYFAPVAAVFFYVRTD
jgi:hypothetical protein